MTGRPSMAARMARKSSFWTRRSSSRASVSSSGVWARIMRRTTGRRSSPRNMCSVRHRPMPSAPSVRALAASSPVSALVRTARWPLRISSAHESTVSKAAGGLAAVSGTWPATTMPAPPSRETQSPSDRVTPPARHRAVAQAEHLGADHGRLAPAPGHDGGVADQAAPGGEDALGRPACRARPRARSRCAPG